MFHSSHHVTVCIPVMKGHVCQFSGERLISVYMYINNHAKGNEGRWGICLERSYFNAVQEQPT